MSQAAFVRKEVPGTTEVRGSEWTSVISRAGRDEIGFSFVAELSPSPPIHILTPPLQSRHRSKHKDLVALRHSPSSSQS